MSEENEEEGGGGWLVSYADLMTLLFAAFVVLYGITPQGESPDILSVASSIRESFIEIPDEIKEETREAEQFDKKFVFKIARPQKPLEREFKKFNPDDNNYSPPEKLKSEVQAVLKKLEGGSEGLYQNITKGIVVSDAERTVRLSFQKEIGFGLGENKLSNAAKQSLKEILPQLQRAKRILIEGHALMSESALGVEPALLGAIRADNTKTYLTKILKVTPPVNISTAGALRPRHINKTDQPQLEIYLEL